MNEPLSLDDHLPDNLRIPPHSQEAEQAVLGGLLLNNEAWDEVAERVGPKDFYRKEHRLIFQVVDQLVEEEKPCDLVRNIGRFQVPAQLLAALDAKYGFPRPER